MINLNISKRLKCIASFVDEKDKVIYDVGCDHALLDIYLAQKYQNINFFAIDISKKCIEKAIENIEKFNLKNRISAFVNDGLMKLKIKKDSTLVISGMGTHTILNIINECDFLRLKKIIIQSNNDLDLLRCEMIKRGFKINCEKVVFDKKFYVVISFIHGVAKYDNNDLLFGPCLLTEVDKNIDYFMFLYNKTKEILKKIPLLNIRKKIELQIYLNKLKKLLKK